METRFAWLRNSWALISKVLQQWQLIYVVVDAAIGNFSVGWPHWMQHVGSFATLRWCPPRTSSWTWSWRALTALVVGSLQEHSKRRVWNPMSPMTRPPAGDETPWFFKATLR